MRVVPAVPLATVAREWGRIGILGFGGPPAHIALLRDLTVERRGWIEAREFEDAFAACSLLPGPASTQMAIYTGQRVAGRAGALVGGLAFIAPGLLLILVIAALAFAGGPLGVIAGIGAGASAAVIAIVVHAGIKLAHVNSVRAAFYIAAGAAGAALAGAAVVGVLLLCGIVELAYRTARHSYAVVWPALIWMAFKVGALSFGGGYVIIPLMYGDAVEAHAWMTDYEFANAVAFGQLTPGPVTHTVAMVGYYAAGMPGALAATAIAFAPSFVLVMLGARHFGRLRTSPHAARFLDGAGPAAAGAIIGAAVPLAQSLETAWQWVVLGVAAFMVAFRAPPLPVLVFGALVGLASTLY
jgi:chromate transporter